jgi:hypothetical protein
MDIKVFISSKCIYIFRSYPVMVTVGPNMMMLEGNQDSPGFTQPKEVRAENRLFCMTIFKGLVLKTNNFHVEWL